MTDNLTATVLNAESQLSTTLLYWTYRIHSYIWLNVIDDPAWLALMFC